jgi:hypothetical protein
MLELQGSLILVHESVLKRCRFLIFLVAAVLSRLLCLMLSSAKQTKSKKLVQVTQNWFLATRDLSRASAFQRLR